MDLLRYRTCESCRELRSPEQYKTAGARACIRCKRKGWFPPDYLETSTDERVVQFLNGAPPWRYPLTVHQQRLLREAQKGQCAICRRHIERMHVDHCHKRGLVRGMLCANCNNGMGFFRDDPELMRAAAAYLEHPFLPMERTADTVGPTAER